VDSASALDEAIFTDRRPGIVCRPGFDSHLNIQDCHSALSFMTDTIKKHKSELVRNARHRALGEPSRMDRALSQGRFRLPAEIFYGSCSIRVRLDLEPRGEDSDEDGESGEDSDSVEEEDNGRQMPQLLSTKQYLYFWEERVPHDTKEILRRCLRYHRSGMAAASVTVDSQTDLIYSIRISGRSISGLAPSCSIQLAWLLTTPSQIRDVSQSAAKFNVYSFNQPPRDQKIPKVLGFKRPRPPA
jgi:hypothetical protein